MNTPESFRQNIGRVHRSFPPPPNAVPTITDGEIAIAAAILTLAEAVTESNAPYEPGGVTLEDAP